jgi:hypothetical protein
MDGKRRSAQPSRVSVSGQRRRLLVVTGVGVAQIGRAAHPRQADLTPVTTAHVAVMDEHPTEASRSATLAFQSRPGYRTDAHRPFPVTPPATARTIADMRA